MCPIEYPKDSSLDAERIKIKELFLPDSPKKIYCPLCRTDTPRFRRTGRCSVCNLNPDWNELGIYSVDECKMCEFCNTRTTNHDSNCNNCCNNIRIMGNDDIIDRRICFRCENSVCFEKIDEEVVCSQDHKISDHCCVPVHSVFGVACYCGGDLRKCACGKTYCLECGHDDDTDECEEEGCLHGHYYVTKDGEDYCARCYEDDAPDYPGRQTYGFD